MAIVNLVSNLRIYNPKFKNFGVNQVVDQPIPAEPNRTAPSNLDRRLDDYDRLEAFLASGKGRTFAAKQAGLDQAARGTTVKERIGEAANTAARLTNILLQVAPKAALLAGEAGVPQTGIPGEIIRYSPEVTARFSSHPFLRYIEARGVGKQIGNLLRADAPSLALRGKTIIPDNEWETPNTGEESEEGLRGFFRRIGNFRDNVRTSEAFTENIEKNSTSLSSSFASEGSKFDKPVSVGYLEDPDSGSTSVPSRERVKVKQDFTINRPGTNQTNATGSSLNSTFPEIEYTDYASGQSGLGEAMFNIRTKAKNAGNFAPRKSYAEQLVEFNNFDVAFDGDVSDIKIYVITPTSTQILNFTAYIDSFSDTYTGNWNGTTYIGRAEELYNYTGFSRDYIFSFKVASLKVNDLTNLYRKLNTLASTTAPTYSGTFMRGTYVRLKIGDYLDLTPGFITSVVFGWNTTYPWQAQTTQQRKVDELNAESGKYESLPLVPHILDVSCNFTPIHNFTPQTNINLDNIARPYITDGTLTSNFVTDPAPEQADTNAENATITSEEAQANIVLPNDLAALKEFLSPGSLPTPRAGTTARRSDPLSQRFLNGQ